MTNLPLRFIKQEPNTRANSSVILLHGLGANGHDMEALANTLKFPAGWNPRFIFPHAPQIQMTVFQKQTMPSWYDIKSTIPERETDDHSVDLSVGQILKFIEAEMENGIPSNKILLGGFSQGGALAAETMMHCNKKIAGLIMLSCYILYPEKIKTGRIQKTNLDTPIFMAHGKADDVIPFQLAQSSATTLKEANYNLYWKQYSELPHSISQEEINDLNNWLVECRV